MIACLRMVRPIAPSRVLARAASRRAKAARRPPTQRKPLVEITLARADDDEWTFERYRATFDACIQAEAASARAGSEERLRAAAAAADGDDAGPSAAAAVLRDLAVVHDSSGLRRRVLTLSGGGRGAAAPLRAGSRCRLSADTQPGAWLEGSVVDAAERAVRVALDEAPRQPDAADAPRALAALAPEEGEGRARWRVEILASDVPHRRLMRATRRFAAGPAEFEDGPRPLGPPRRVRELILGAFAREQSRDVNDRDARALLLDDDDSAASDDDGDDDGATGGERLASALGRSGATAAKAVVGASGLDASQRRAVLRALAAPAETVTLVQGPPGTGKTRVTAALVAAWSGADAALGGGAGALVCAPSHVATDELLDALSAHAELDGSDGQSLVRLGHAERVRSPLRALTLDAAVEAAVAASRLPEPDSSPVRAPYFDDDCRERRERQHVRACATRLALCRDRLAAIEAARAAAPFPEGGRGANEWAHARDAAAAALRSLEEALLGGAGVEFDAVRAAVDVRPDMRSRRSARALEGAVERAEPPQPRVMCSTCSGAAGAALEGRRFGLVVIDEAAQATEPEALAALNLLAPGGKAVLVGDPLQLPPTVLARACAVQPNPLHVSLFERLAKLRAAGGPLAKRVRGALLGTQYRMHPELAAWASEFVYRGRVKSGVDAAARPPVDGFPWPLRESGGARGGPPRRSPVAFVHVPSCEETSARAGGFSKLNRAEAEVVALVVRRLLRAHRGEEAPSIGVIAPYTAQARLLRTLLRDDEGAVEIATVDGFQGREKEVVVLATTRANARGELGFLTDVRRLNVALTRARRGLVVIGDTRTLNNSAAWASWLSAAREKGQCLDASDIT